MKAILLCGSVLLAAGVGQKPTTPPIKMGLWESTLSMRVTVSGKEQPPFQSKARHCYSADMWVRSAVRKDCELSNESWSPQHYSYDLSCPREHNMTTHMQVDFLNAESMHAVAHIRSSSNGPDSAIGTVEEHFVRAGCGSISPGKLDVMP
jgi:hypothetical protein